MPTDPSEAAIWLLKAAGYVLLYLAMIVAGLAGVYGAFEPIFGLLTGKGKPTKGEYIIFGCIWFLLALMCAYVGFSPAIGRLWSWIFIFLCAGLFLLACRFWSNAWRSRG